MDLYNGRSKVIRFFENKSTFREPSNQRESSNFQRNDNSEIEPELEPELKSDIKPEPSYEESISERTKIRRQTKSDNENQEGQGLKILTQNQMLGRLPISLAQLKAGNNPENL